MAALNRRGVLRLVPTIGMVFLGGCSGTFSGSGEPEKIKGMAPGEYRDKVEEDLLEQSRKSRGGPQRKKSR